MHMFACECVLIKKKKYQLFWSVVDRNSHSPLSCTHLARPQEKGEREQETEQ